MPAFKVVKEGEEDYFIVRGKERFPAGKIHNQAKRVVRVLNSSENPKLQVRFSGLYVCYMKGRHKHEDASKCNFELEINYNDLNDPD